MQIEEKICWAKRMYGFDFFFLNNFDLCINIGGRVLFFFLNNFDLCIIGGEFKFKIYKFLCQQNKYS